MPIDLIELDSGCDRGGLDFSGVVMLDFDGVLHPEGANPGDYFCFLPNVVEVFEAIDPQGRVPVVISSKWRDQHPLRELRDHFPDAFARRIVGVTPDLAPKAPAWQQYVAWERGDTHIGSPPALRQRECETWVSRHAPGAAWLAIDDTPGGFEPGCRNLFLVPPAHDGFGAGLHSGLLDEFMARFAEFVAACSTARRPPGERALQP